jgi:hypothetical protein
MVQPKYSPEEALQRVKLMMNYDLSKTSVENKKIVLEQTKVAPGYTDPNKQSTLKRKDSPLSDILKNQSINKSVCRKNIKDFYDIFKGKAEVDKPTIEQVKKIVQRCKNQHYGKFGMLGVGGDKIDNLLDILSGSKPGGPPTSSLDPKSIFRIK